MRALLAAAVLTLLLGCAGTPSETTTIGGEDAVGTRTGDGGAVADREESAPVTATKDSPSGETNGGTRGSSAAEPDAFAMTEEEPGGPAAAEPSSTAASGDRGRGGTTTAVRPQAQASGLRAGFADDNRQFNYFAQFLEKYADAAPHESMDTQERVVIRVTDNAGKPVAGAQVTVSSGQTRLLTAPSYADGTVLFFPRMFSAASSYRITAAAQGRTTETTVDREGRRSVDLALPAARSLPARVGLDVVFVMDTTGSMGEEIERLKLTIELINMNLTAVSTHPRVRFGLVVYKDVGDEYVTRVVQPTEDLEAFQSSLSLITAEGGGDTPEDLQSALRETVNTIEWAPASLRLAFVITDAPPHLDYGDPYTYVDAARDAQAKGIKIHTVGTGGLGIDGEYVLRQISQYTYGKYIFLTYGEQGEAEGGAAGSVSHHTGANFQTDKLETIIIRLAREELAYQSDTPLEPVEEYFEAVRVTDEQRTETLAKLFDMAMQQLIDYSSVRLPATTRAAGVPLVAAEPALAPQAEYLTEQLVLSLSRSRGFQVVSRADLQAILTELELQMSGLVDDATAARVGDLMGAEVLVTGRVFAKPDRYEVFLKLLRVSTGEILSVTKALVDRQLGI